MNGNGPGPVRGKLVRRGGKGGKKGGPPLDYIAEQFVIAKFPLHKGEFKLTDIASSAHPRVSAWTRQAVTDYEEMTDLSELEKFACRYADGDNHDELEEWWQEFDDRSALVAHQPTRGSSGSLGTDADDDDDFQFEESEAMFGGQELAPTSKRSHDDIDEMEIPEDMKEYMRRMKRSFRAQIKAEFQGAVQDNQSLVKMVMQMAADAQSERRRVATLESRLATMQAELNTYASRTNTLDERMTAADSVGETYCNVGTDELVPMTNNQIRALGRAMQEAFKLAGNEQRSIMIKLLRFEDVPIEGANLTAVERRSVQRCFDRGQLSLNLWLDVAPRLDVAWRLYNYLVQPRCAAYKVLPPKGQHWRSIAYPNARRLPQPSPALLPLHGDPEGDCSPRPMSVMRSMSSLGSSSSAPNLAIECVVGRRSRTTNTPGFEAMDLLSPGGPLPPTFVGAATGPTSPSLAKQPVMPLFHSAGGLPLATPAVACQPKKKKPPRARKTKHEEEDDDDDDGDESDALFNSDGGLSDDAAEEVQRRWSGPVCAAAAARGKSSSRRERFEATRAVEQETADTQAESAAWAPGGASFMAAFADRFEDGVPGQRNLAAPASAEDAETLRSKQDDIARARGVVPDYSGGV